MGPRLCSCGSGQYAIPRYDAQNIYLESRCDKCWPKEQKKYRPEILTGYSQADVDEPIDPDD
jgi:hypothetical protein